MKKNKYDTSREAKLKSSLKYLDDHDIPQFPQIEVVEKSYVWHFVVAILIALMLIFQSLFMVVRVSGHSMDSTLHDGQFLLAKRHEKVDRFDIVVLNEREEDGGKSKVIIKRVIGLPGDVVSVIDGKLYVNDKKYQEDYVDKKNADKFGDVDWTIKVPEDHVFVLGDNRDISKDSRSVGSFKTTAIEGVKILGGNK